MKNIIDCIYFLAFLALIIFTYYLICTSIKYHKYHKLHDLASWSISGDYCPSLQQYSFISEQIHFLLDSQDILSVPEKYRISNTDYQAIASVLADFQLYLARKIALSEIETSGKPFWRMSRKDFFMAHLHDFLMYSQKWWIRKDHNYENIIKEQGSNKLTSFGICVFKMHYITHLYCKGNSLFNPSASKYWNNDSESRILSVLDSGIYLGLNPPTS